MANSWQASVKQAADWFNARPLRERGLITVTVLIATLFVGWELSVTPALKSKDVLEDRLEVLSSTRERLLMQQQTLNEQLATDPSQALRNELAGRQARLERLEQQIADSTAKLIAPKAMVSLLKDMLSAQQSLGLESLELKAPEPVFAPATGDADDGQPANAEPLLYAHDVELKIRGSYLDVLAYLERLESLDERLGWVTFEYDANSWPAGEAVVRVRTLSLEPVWLGV
ncbi:type II secretion system protein M [Marinobacter salinisoli]|uniref:Type II secretion system protein M n=1 Tax=Marinobacter salinisoli TaxID=2769486 RepID=A0ABX7MUG1_9GAMM|nr:type II secretion system protein M [Marinobacter salinisoli]QSP96027.1 type II secretion system protein M [Marinobacter salinisoli]